MNPSTQDLASPPGSLGPASGARPSRETLERAQAVLEAVRDSVERVIIGKREAVELALIALVAEGHVLVEDVPGTGKSTLARALSKSLDVSFKRVQCTSDLLPSDVLGLSVYSRSTEQFEFRPGPIFSQVLLADELNRTSPRTQSAFLECMQERRVSIEGETRELERPFFVIATQNPSLFEGTYPLPESELDRFLLSFALGYPDRTSELAVLDRFGGDDPTDALEPVANARQLLHAIEAARGVHVDESIKNYILDVVDATRTSDWFELGASTRGSLAWVRAARAKAVLRGRDFVTPDDVIELAFPVLVHRLVTKNPADDRARVQAALEQVLDGIEAPR